jgi:GNAT superfamily N-acetyltransferase
VFAFTADTWQGGDYIPRVWDAWLADPRGAFVVGVDAADAPLALGKLSVNTDGAGWLEGVRVASTLRGGGWGRALMADLVARADTAGLPVVRFITEHDNTPIHHIAAALGFWREGEYHPHRVETGGGATRGTTASDAGPAAAGTARRARPAEAAALWAAAGAALAPAAPLRWRSWAGERATAEWFAAAVAEGRVLVAADGRSLAVVAHEREGRDADLALLAGAPAAMPELLAAARAWAATVGAERLLGLLPPAAVPAAAADGWEPYTARPMWLYRRDRPDGARAERA